MLFVSPIVSPQTGFVTSLSLGSHPCHMGIIEICLSRSLWRLKMIYREVPSSLPNSKQPLNTWVYCISLVEGWLFRSMFFLPAPWNSFPHGYSPYPRGSHRHENSGLGSCCVLKGRYSWSDLETGPGGEGEGLRRACWHQQRGQHHRPALVDVLLWSQTWALALTLYPNTGLCHSILEY